MADTTRDELLGRLLGMPLDRFVEQRNRLARELRDQGDRDAAAWLASLRRPSPAVWALDQVARGDPARLRTLLDRGAELRDVQARAMRGDREAAAQLCEVGGQVQRAVDDIVRRAAALLRDAGHGVSSDTTLSMAAMLRTALTADGETQRRLAAGLLLQPVEESGSAFGFDAGPPQLRVIDGGGAAKPRSAAAAAPGKPDAEARRRAAELRRRAEEALHAADAADREAAARQAESERLRGRVSELRARMRELENQLSDAETAARGAEVAAREAAAQARAARLEAEAAEAAAPRD